MEIFLVAGCTVTFLAAFLCSLGIKLSRSDIENTQAQLQR